MAFSFPKDFSKLFSSSNHSLLPILSAKKGKLISNSSNLNETETDDSESDENDENSDSENENESKNRQILKIAFNPRSLKIDYNWIHDFLLIGNEFFIPAELLSKILEFYEKISSEIMSKQIIDPFVKAFVLKMKIKQENFDKERSKPSKDVKEVKEIKEKTQEETDKERKKAIIEQAQKEMEADERKAKSSKKKNDFEEEEKKLLEAKTNQKQSSNKKGNKKFIEEEEEEEEFEAKKPKQTKKKQQDDSEQRFHSERRAGVEKLMIELRNLLNEWTKSLNFESQNDKKSSKKPTKQITKSVVPKEEKEKEVKSQKDEADEFPEVEILQKDAKNSLESAKKSANQEFPAGKKELFYTLREKFEIDVNSLGDDVQTAIETLFRNWLSQLLEKVKDKVLAQEQTKLKSFF